MATQQIHEPIAVIASFRQTARGATQARPEIMHWKGRRYRVDQIGLRYPTSKGARMLHRFTFAVNDTTFEVEFDAERLTWELVSLSDGNPS
jgi:hypothetical protein